MLISLERLISSMTLALKESSNELSTQQQKVLLRKQLRAKRQKLSQQSQSIASRKLLQNLKRSGLLLKAQHIALYLGNDGEIFPRELSAQLRRWGKKAYLPVIHPFKKQEILFCQVHEGALFKKNRFGIEEPNIKHSKRLLAKRLSLALMPLVAFDKDKNRMGMGGGFYDRAFNYKLQAPASLPRLVGLAHDFQKQTALQ